MNIRIKSFDVCLSCGNRTCCFKDAQIRENFYGLRSETTVCPTAVLSESPASMAKNGIIEGKNCIDCGLCVLSCHSGNLECIDLKYADDPFPNLSEQQTNAIACSYLDVIYDFAANTNRNKAMQFDGYVSTLQGKEAFVEVDRDDDSLECVRRLISDFLLYSPADRAINIGVVVLDELPKRGNRDVFQTLEKLSQFPTTGQCTFYFTTFRLLRLLALNVSGGQSNYGDLLLDIRDDGCVAKLFNYVSEHIPKIREEARTLLGLQ